MDPYESPQVDPYAEAEATEGDAAAPATGEQLGLEHIGLYVAGVIVAVWFNGFLLNSLLSFRFDPYVLPDVVHALVVGAGVAAIGLAAWRRFQARLTFPVQFGHWILLAVGTNFLVQALYETIQLRALSSAFRDPERMELIPDSESGLLVLQLFLWCGAALVPALAVRYSRGERYWQRYGIFLTLNVAWNGILPVVGGVQRSWELLVATALLRGISLICLFMALAGDLSRSKKHDPLHWIGIGSLFGLAASGVLRAFQFLWI